MVVRDIGDRTTISIVRQDKDWMTENVPGNSDWERFAKMAKFYRENYNVPNIKAWARELNEELDPLNKHIIEGVKKVLGERNG